MLRGPLTLLRCKEEGAEVSDVVEEVKRRRDFEERRGNWYVDWDLLESWRREERRIVRIVRIVSAVISSALKF